MKVVRLDAASAEATVDYFRCSACGHVWNIAKNTPGAKPRSVTIKRPPPE